MSKQKQIRTSIYPEVYQRLVESQEYVDHGLSFAVNSELSRAYGLELPPTPTKLMADGARKQLRSKKLHSILLPANWLELLEVLVTGGEPWFRKDYPQFANISGKCELVKFLPNRGALPTQKLKKIWIQDDKIQILKKLYFEAAKNAGYGLNIEE